MMTPTPPTAPLGGRPVRRMGFGAMQLAGPGVFGPPKDRDAAVAVLRRAVDLGVDHIDTAQYYGPDVVNALIRDALHPYDPGLRLVTKVGARRDARGGWVPAQRPEELRAGVEANLAALGVDAMAMVNLRLLDDPPPGVGLADQVGELDDMRREGKVELIGLSNATRAQLDEALAVAPVAAVQNGYSILDRSGEDVLDRCRERDIAFVPFFPLGSAFTGGPARLAADPAVRAVAARRDATPSQVALAWLLHRDERILLIPGTSSVAHLEENMAAAAIALDDRDLAELEGVPPAVDPLAAVEHADG